MPLRILTPESKREQARYAMGVTEQVLPFFTEYFGVPYALPKLDQLAVAGVRRGAMEDWGLISYTEPAILFDPATSSPQTTREVFGTVAHEISHQWFGNLVTAGSWEEIWLNEAFATWMAAKATERFRPEWNSTLHRRTWLDQTMARDATSATRAIRSGPVSEASVFDVFDSITYSKGGAVLSMLEQWIGPEVFRQGLADYMAGQRMSNATAGDLWHYIGKSSGQEVARVAATWTDQPGLPLIEVTSRCRADRTVVMLKQQRFAIGNRPLPAQRWKIPMLLSQGKSQAKLLLEAAEQEVELGACSDAPVLANAGGVGYYRVQYAAGDLAAATRASAQLEPADRVALLSDTFALAQAGRVPMASYFTLLACLPAVTDESRAPLYAMAMESLRFLDVAMAGTPAQPLLRAKARSLLGPALERLGWEGVAGEDPEATTLRSRLIVNLARFDDRAVIRAATQRFDAQASGTVLPAAIRAGVIQAVGMHADRTRFNALLASLREAAGEEDRWLYASSLAAGRDAGRARQLLAVSLDGSLPPNIAAALPGKVGEDSPHHALAYAFVRAHWEPLAALAGGMFGAGADLLPDAASGSNRATRAAQLVADQRTLAGPEGAAAAAQVASRIELQARVRERDAAALAAYLARAR